MELVYDEAAQKYMVTEGTAFFGYFAGDPAFAYVDARNPGETWAEEHKELVIISNSYYKAWAALAETGRRFYPA